MSIKNLLINAEEANTLDAEELHLRIIKSVENGEYDTCIEALADFIDKNDIDEYDILNYISSSLKDIIHVEACKIGYMKNDITCDITDLFV